VTNDEGQGNEARLRAAQEYHRKADDLLSFRMSYGMVAQAMFLVAYVTILAADHDGRAWLKWVEIAVATLGFWYSLVMIASIGSLNARLAFLSKEYLEPLDPVWATYKKILPTETRWFRQRHLPRAMSVIWLFLGTVSAIWSN
jgi:hypothetical protein